MKAGIGLVAEVLADARSRLECTDERTEIVHIESREALEGFPLGERELRVPVKPAKAAARKEPERGCPAGHAGKIGNETAGSSGNFRALGSQAPALEPLHQGR